MKVYIAGPMFSSGHMTDNIRRALKVAKWVAELGFVPFVPHLYFFWDLVDPEPADFWLKLDKAWLKSCDVMLRLPGESTGCDQEVEWAQSWSMAVYTGDSDEQVFEKFKDAWSGE